MIFNLGAKEVLGVIESDSTKLIGSYESALKINEIHGGVMSQGENPSPTNPQEIRNVSISGIKTHGKNLLNPSLQTTTRNGVTCTRNSDDTYTLNGTATAKTEFVVFYNGNGVFKGRTLKGVGCPKGGSYTSYKGWFTDVTVRGENDVGGGAILTPSTNELKYIIEIASGYSCNNIVFKPMISEDLGVKYDDYQPYTESTITFSQPIELYGLDDVQDILTTKQIKRKFVKRVYNGSENWTITTGGGYSNVMRLILDDYKQTDSNSINYMFSNFTAITADERYKEETAFISGRYMLCLSSMFTTVDEWKAHLASNPMTVIYELAEETTEELLTPDQIALSQLKTFNGMTYVEFISDVQPTLKSEYATNIVGVIALNAWATNELGIARGLVNKAENENEVFGVKIENGLIYLYKDDVLHGVVGANTVIHSSSGKKYKSINVRAEEDADFIALTNKNNSISYYMNVNKIPLTGNGYTEPHYFNGDMRVNGNLKTTGGIWSDETHITKMGINGGAAQSVEWVWDAALARWVLCSSDTGIERG